jgi:O-methyltransferase involved in polyketide biosynthesis
MDSFDKKLKMEPTAALVMKWALSLYQKSPALEFVKRLDLSSGTMLYEKCRSVCDWYGEVILNRKSFIRHLIEQSLTADERKYQLIILAAGKSPMAIEIMSQYAMKIHRVFEIDISGMDDKQCIYNNLFPEYADKIKCIKSDISCGDIPLILNDGNNGYSREFPSIIVIEGISYYLKEKDLKGIIEGFRRQAEAYFIIEYLVPGNCICQSRKYIPQQVFEIIHDDCELDGITKYTKEKLQTFFKECGGKLLNCYTMTDMELNRTGTNTYFKDRADGWIECATGITGTNHPE